MKKILIVASALLCGLVMTACGSGGGNDAPETQTTASQATEATTAANETEAATQAATEAKTQAETEADETDTETQAETEAASDDEPSGAEIGADGTITVALNSEYTGSWTESAAIPLENLTVFGGDVRVVLTVETYNATGLSDQFILQPCFLDAESGAWTKWIDNYNNTQNDGHVILSDTAVAKPDGYIGVPEGQTAVEFVVPAELIGLMDAEKGFFFHVQNVTITSAELSVGDSQKPMRQLKDSAMKRYCKGESYEDLTAEDPTFDPTL